MPGVRALRSCRVLRFSVLNLGSRMQMLCLSKLALLFVVCFQGNGKFSRPQTYTVLFLGDLILQYPGKHSQ